MHRARFSNRAAAWVLDTVLIIMFQTGLKALFIYITGLDTLSEFTIVNWMTGIIALGLALLYFPAPFLYYGWCWSRYGQSVGKWAFGIRVVTQEEKCPSFLRAGLRGTLGYLVSGIPLGVGFLWAAFDFRSETWHDKIFRTCVEQCLSD